MLECLIESLTQGYIILLLCTLKKLFKLKATNLWLLRWRLILLLHRVALSLLILLWWRLLVLLIWIGLLLWRSLLLLL